MLRKLLGSRLDLNHLTTVANFIQDAFATFILLPRVDNLHMNKSFLKHDNCLILYWEEIEYLILERGI